MNARIVSVLAALLVVSVLALSSNAAAAEHTIRAGESYTIEVEFSFMEFLSYSWSSDIGLDFVIRDPAGSQYFALADSTSWSSGSVPVIVSGMYTFTWTNNDVLNAHLEFDVSGAFDEVEEAMSMLVWAMIIAGIIVVAVVVIVIIVVVMGGKKAPAQPTMGPLPQTAAQALATGHCPTCGNQIDMNASFCAKCGTKYR